MKKLITNIIIVTLFMLFPVSVFASGNISVSTSSLSIEVGSSKTFTITAYNAIGDAKISTSNSGIASISSNKWETGIVGENQTVTGNITVTGNSVGTATITLELDGATFDSPPDKISGQRTITVNVVPKQTPAPQPSPPSPQPQPSPQPSTNHSPQPQTPTTPETPKSSNTNISSIKVDDYKLDTTDNVNFTLTVKNSVDNININVKAEDTKSKVEGNGNKTLKIGDNKFEIKITAEDGTSKVYTINIKRKTSNFTIFDIDDALSEKEDVIIKLQDNDKITKEILEKVKSSKKTIRFSKYDSDNKEIYTWTIDGSKLSKIVELDTDITDKIDNKDKFEELSEYRNGIYIKTGQEEYPTSTKLKVNVEKNYKNGDSINIYYYDSKNNKISLLKTEKVKNGSIELDLSKGSNYFLTKATLDKKVVESDFNPYIVSTIVELFAIVGILFYMISKNNKKEKQPEQKSTENVQ